MMVNTTPVFEIVKSGMLQAFAGKGFNSESFAEIQNNMPAGSFTIESVATTENADNFYRNVQKEMHANRWFPVAEIYGGSVLVVDVLTEPDYELHLLDWDFGVLHLCKLSEFHRFLGRSRMYDT